MGRLLAQVFLHLKSLSLWLLPFFTNSQRYQKSVDLKVFTLAGKSSFTGWRIGQAPQLGAEGKVPETPMHEASTDAQIQGHRWFNPHLGSEKIVPSGDTRGTWVVRGPAQERQAPFSPTSFQKPLRSV